MSCDSFKKRIAIIGGASETGLHPVPPVADGAPQWNVFRLTEAAALTDDTKLEFHVVSPCEATQFEGLQKYPVQASGKYHHVVFDRAWLRLYRRILRHIAPLRWMARRIALLPDLNSWYYLRRLQPIMKSLQPDVIILNDRPQYIRYVRQRWPKAPLLLMLRYPIGESRHYLGQLDGILVNSEGMKGYVEQFIPPGAPTVWKIPNALQDGAFGPDPGGRPPATNEKVVLFAGRLIEEKGVGELLLAIRMVQRELPNTMLVICGIGEKDGSGGGISRYERELSRLADLCLPGTVQFAGYINNLAMNDLYRQADAAVFPSLPGIYRESFGMVALEAMRCGKPVIASRQPGFEELIVPDKTGLLVDDPRDTASLAEAILHILKNPDLAQEMGKAGYERSLEYTPERALRSLEEIVCRMAP